MKKLGDGSVQVMVENWRRNLGKPDEKEGSYGVQIEYGQEKLR